MLVHEDNPERTVLVFRPRGWLLLALFLGLTGLAGWAWRATGTTGWLIAGSVLLLLSAAMVLALGFNRRTITFDWTKPSVDIRGHNWNPLFKDEIAHQSLAALDHWTVTQEDNRLGRAGRAWTIGFERTTGKAVDELLFERTLVEARRKAALLGQHSGRPVKLVSSFDTFPANAPPPAPDMFAETIGRFPRMRAFQPGPHPQVHIEDQTPGHLKIHLPTDRRKIPTRGGLSRRWPLMLFEGVAGLVVAVSLPLAQSRPHPLYALALVYALIVIPIAGVGCACLWIGLRDLTGRTDLEVLGGMLRLTQTVLGAVPYRRVEVSAQKCEATLVAKVGYNPCLLVVIGDREYRLGAGLPAVELLRARHALTRVVAEPS